MADHQIVSEEALTAIASDIKTDIRAKADSSNVYTKSATDTLLEGKADTEGEYDGLTVGNAKQLVATVGETDKTPYLFRTAGGALDIGDRETDELVGGSVAFNQLTDVLIGTTSGITKALTNGVIELSGTSDSGVGSIKLSSPVQHYDGHKYLCLYSVLANPNSVVFTVGVGAGQPWFNNQYAVGNYSKIYTSNYYTQFGIYDLNNTNLTGVKLRLNEFDLTQMFGATIADYIYSLEQATVGAGVAWFKRLFNKPYYAYNAGELISVKTSGHKLIGFNAFNEDMEIGAISVSTGEPVNDNTMLRSKTFSKCVPNTSYNLSYLGSVNASGMRVFLYDADYNYIDFWGFTNNVGRIIDFGNACYFKVGLNAEYGTTYKNDICVNISWDGERDGEYEPYEANTYPLDADLELRGIPKLDADNKLYYDGDIYSSDGSVSRRYGIVDLGSLTWTGNGDIEGGKQYFTESVNKANGVDNILCALFVTKYPSIEIGTCQGRANSNAITVNSSITDINAFRTAMSGVYLIYELATPTDETADAFTNPQIVNDFGTEEYIDDRAVPIPVGHNTFYEINLRAKLEMSPDSPESNGDYLMRHTSEGNAYTPYVSPIPALPSSDGNFVLKCTVSGSTKTLTWVEET